MTPKQFVECFARERDHLVREYTRGTDTAVGGELAALELSPAKKAKLRTVLESILTDAFYTVLLALDGAASLGGKQMAYSLRDEKGRELTAGDLEAFAWERFHGPGSRRGRGRKRK